MKREFRFSLGPYDIVEIVPVIDGAMSVSSNESYLAGYCFGDGTVTVRGRAQILWTEGQSNDDRLQKICTEVLGVTKFPVYQRVYPNGVWRMRQITKTTHVFDKWGLPGHRAWNKEIPEWLFKECYEIRAQFLAGCWDSDGCSKKRGTHGEFYLTTVSKDMAEGYRRLLETMGVLSKIKTEVDKRPNRRILYRVIVENAYLENLKRACRFQIDYKRDQLLTYSPGGRGSRRFCDGMGDYLRSRHKVNHLVLSRGNKESFDFIFNRKESEPTFDWLMKLKEKFPDWCKGSVLDFLESGKTYCPILRSTGEIVIPGH